MSSHLPDARLGSFPRFETACAGDGAGGGKCGRAGAEAAGTARRNPGRTTPPKPDPARKPTAGKSTNGNSARRPGADTPSGGARAESASTGESDHSSDHGAGEEGEKVVVELIEGTTEERAAAAS